MNKIKNYFILFLIVLAFGVFVYYQAKVSHLQKVIDAKAPPDTIKIEIIQHDTTVVKKADTVETIKVVHGDTIYVYKRFFGEFDQPLFHLGVWANSQTEEFTFNIKYRSLKLFLEIKNKYDIRKGFNLRTEPDLGITYSVDWNNYTPLRKERNFRLNLGFGYSKEQGPFLLPGIQYKSNILGVFLKENSWGLYYQKSFGIF
jgi:hypothetical protein